VQLVDEIQGKHSIYFNLISSRSVYVSICFYLWQWFST